MHAHIFGSDTVNPEHNSDFIRPFPPEDDATRHPTVGDVAAQLSHLLDSPRPGDPAAVYELRAIGVESFDWDGPHKEVWSGVFYHYEADVMAREILRLSGRCRGIYLILNPLAYTRFGYSATAERMKESRHASRDRDIPTRERMIFDVDPAKVAGHEDDPANDSERRAAWETACKLIAFNHARGWPTPTVVDSGNGYQLHYRIESLPFGGPDDAHLVPRILKAADKRFSVPGVVNVDTTVGNPARPVRAPGGLNCKGAGTEDRPYRRARVILVGSPGRVTHEQLEAAAAEIEEPKAVPVSAASATAGQSRGGYAAGSPILTTSQIEARAVALLDRIPGAVEGQGGSKLTLWAARCLVRGFRLSQADALRLLQVYYNPRCSPPWPDHQLARKVDQAATLPFGKPDGWLLDSPIPAKFTAAPAAGYEDITETEAAELAGQQADAFPAPPEPCPYTASREMRDELKLHPPRCRNQSPKLFEKGSVAFVCNRDCGNGTKCRACLTKRLHKVLRETDSYIIRTMTEVENHAERRVIYAGFMPDAPSEAVKKAVLRSSGERLSIMTDDLAGCAARLLGLPAEEAVSRFLPGEKNKGNGEIGTPAVTRLYLVSLPAGAEPPEWATSGPILAANAIRAVHHAAKTVPAVPEGTVRFKPVHKSSDWGDKEERQPSEAKCIGDSAFRPREVREICQEAGVPTVRVNFDRGHSQTAGDGWILPPVKSAAMKVWIRGENAPAEMCDPTTGRFRGTVEDVAELARYWLPRLPVDLGEGPRVRRVLCKYVWGTSRLYGIEGELRRAHEDDLSHAAVESAVKELGIDSAQFDLIPW